MVSDSATPWAVCSRTDLAVRGISRARILESPPPGALPDPGIEPVSCIDGQSFYHCTPWGVLFFLFYSITNKKATVLNDIHLLICLTSPPHPNPFKTDIFTFIPGLAISKEIWKGKLLAQGDVCNKSLTPESKVLRWLSGKYLPANAGDPWVRKSPGEGNDNPLQYPCLGNPMDTGAWLSIVHGVPKSQTWFRHWIKTTTCA